MRPFRFRLARLLKLRRSAEKDRARDLGNALHRAREAETALEDSKARRSDAEQQMAREGEGGDVISAGVLSLQQHAVSAARQQEAKSRATHDEALGKVDEEQRRFTDARQQRRSLELLRERQHRSWRADQSRVEQNETDEVASRVNKPPQDGRT